MRIPPAHDPDPGKEPADAPSPEAPPVRGGRARRALSALLLVAAFVALSLFQAAETIEERRVPRRDAEQYVLVAYHLAHDATASMAPPGARPDRPSAHRAPAYPALLAGVILLFPDLRAMTLEEMLHDDALPRLRPFWIVHTCLLLGAAALAMAIVRRATGSWIASWLALFAVGLDTALIGRTANLLSENLATPLFTAFGLVLARAVTGGRLALFGCSGFLLALMTLTRPAFLYVCIPVLLLTLSLHRWTTIERQRCRRAALVFVLAFVPLVAGWMARNAWHFDRFFLAEGTGVNLDIRSRYDMMSLRQGAASFVLWARSPLARRYPPSTWGGWISEDELAFLESSTSLGAYQQAIIRRHELRQEHGGVEADRLQGKEALGRILRHPVRHTLATIPFANRGIYQHEVILSFALYACLFCALVIGAARKEAALVALFLPAMFSFAFHSFLSENIPRYNEPLVPLLWCALIVCAFRAIRRETAPS